MKTPVSLVVAIGASMLAGSLTVPALAQDAVQWTTAEGGNGHWYALVTGQDRTWVQALNAAESQGGDLVTCTSQAENQYVRDQFIPCFGDPPAAWMGGYRDSFGNWRWVTGEIWNYEDWVLGDPNSTASLAALNFYYAESIGCGWADQDQGFQYDAYVVEWSADCNNDGIVDYGQILDGTFSDDNGNGIPDCCDDNSCMPAYHWTTEDGGDGRWYQPVVVTGTWTDARIMAESRGGTLPSVTSAEKTIMLNDLMGTWTWAYVGGMKVGSNWTWINGDAWDYAVWVPGNPSNGSNETVIELRDQRDINNIRPDHVYETPYLALFEWSADCNGDGIVDYGQILDGTYPDENGNGVPDCCDQSIDCVTQWRVEDGGNGHWYRTKLTPGTNWNDAFAAAQEVGGHLATPTTEAENEFIYRLIDSPVFWSIDSFNNIAGPFLGGIQDEGMPAPEAGWQWLSGEEWLYTAWADGQPNNQNNEQNRLHYFSSGPVRAATWNDIPAAQSSNLPGSWIIEWSADCNNDGIVDYGQILDGTLLDDDGDGIPNPCDQPGGIDGIFDVPSEYFAIQDAVDACPEGGTVRIAAGIFYGSDDSVITLPGRSINIIGEGADTIIDGLGSRRGLSGTGSAGNGTIIDGLTFTNCHANGGNDASGTGGGLYLNGVDATVRNCAFIANTANLHGGGMCVFDGTVNVESCTFTDNETISGGQNGGGLYFDGHEDSMAVFDCTFTGNQTTYGGGAFGVWEGGVNLLDCTISDNNSGWGAGGVWFQGGGEIDLDNCTFTGNVATVHGGGFFFENASDIDLANCSFNGNQAAEYGAAGYVNRGGPATISNCVFVENTASGLGGGLLIDENELVNLDGCFFHLNTAFGGGGLQSYNTALVVSGCWFEENLATVTDNDTGGGGLRIYGGSADINNCFFSNNTCYSNGGAMEQVAGGQLTLTDTTLCENSEPVISGSWSDAGGNSIDDFCNSDLIDCNNDGIIDFLQMLEGTIPDDNGNNIPDTCDALDLNGDGSLDAEQLMVALPRTSGSGQAVTDLDLDRFGNVFTGNGSNSGGPIFAIFGTNGLQGYGPHLADPDTVCVNEGPIHPGYSESTVFVGREVSITAVLPDGNSEEVFSGGSALSNVASLAQNADGSLGWLAYNPNPILRSRWDSQTETITSTVFTQDTDNAVDDASGLTWYVIGNEIYTTNGDHVPGSDPVLTGTGLFKLKCGLSPALAGGIVALDDSALRWIDIDSGEVLTIMELDELPELPWAFEDSTHKGVATHEINDQVAMMFAKYGPGGHPTAESQYAMFDLFLSTEDCDENGELDWKQIARDGSVDADGSKVLDVCEQPGGYDGILDVPSEYATIQEAIDDAPEGGVIEVGPGTYNENFNIPAVSITIRSAAGPEETVLQGQTEGSAQGSIIVALGNAGSDISVDGFTFENGMGYEAFGNGATGGGAILAHGENLSITNCIFTDNHATYGGAIDMYNSSWTEDKGILTVSSCQFEQNTAERQGGAINSADATVYIYSSLFTSNSFSKSAQSDEQLGGAVSATNSKVTIDDSDFMQNTTLQKGGAVSVAGDVSELTISECTFTENIGAEDGGAINCEQQNTAEIFDCIFTGNNTDHEGAGVYCAPQSSADIRNCTFDSNHAHNGGGVFFSDDGSIQNTSFTGNIAQVCGGGLSTVGNGEVELVGCVFRANESLNTNEGQGGGALWLQDCDSVLVQDCQFEENSAQEIGGAVMAKNVDCTFDRCEFRLNSADENAGGAAYFLNSSNVVMNLCVLDSNTARFGGAVDCEGGNASFNGCTFTNNVAIQEGGGLYVVNNASVALVSCLLEANSAVDLAVDPPVNGSGGALRNTNTDAATVQIDSTYACGNFPDQISGPFTDNGGGGIGESCDGVYADCNNDGVPDFIQVLDGTISDCDGNGVPDECDLYDEFAASEPRTSNAPGDYIEFDVSALAEAGEAVALRVSALGDYGSPGSFLFIYLDEPLPDSLLGYAFIDSGEDCVENSADFEIPAEDWNAAGLDGDRKILISGTTVVPGLCEPNRFTAVDITVPIAFDDCNSNGLWDACELAEGSVPDSDGDGVMDECDGCANDPLKTEPGACGCGVPDTDTDEDGTPDCIDLCPTWPYECSDDGAIVVVEGRSIQDAINSVSAGGVIEIEAGTFQPTSTLDPNGKALTLRGASDGFNGAPLTILDGQNTIRLIICQNGEGSDTIFENLVIRNGRANDDCIDGGCGGGMRNTGSNPTILNCTFTGNSASDEGGGLYNTASSPTVTGCIFQGNHAEDEGGGMRNWDNSSPMVTDCSFTENTAFYGAGMSTHTGNPTLQACTFNNNTGSNSGSGKYCQFSDSTLTNCTFSGNSATEKGGGMFCNESSPQLNDCVFDLNHAGKWGGGMWNESVSAPTLVGCLFTNNTANIEGGAILNVDSTATLTDCNLQNNHSQNAGAIWCQDNSTLVLDGCTFNQNTADIDGGALYLDNSSGTVSGCTFTGNTAMGQGHAIYSKSNVTLNIDNSTICSNSPEVIAIEGGHDHSAALLSNGRIVCWGSNAHDQCDVPPDTYDPSNPVVSIYLGSWHTIALHADGSLTGWGRNQHGQATPPADLADGSVRVASVAPGEYHTVAVLEDGSVRAWGSNSDGQCDVPAEIAVANPDNPVIKCASGGWHSLAILQNGEVVAWGSNSNGQISGMPTDFGPGQDQRRVVDIVSSFHVIALLEDGSIDCWGRNGESQCNIPAGIGEPGSRVESIYRSAYASWAVLEDNTIINWGGAPEHPEHCPCDFPPEVADPNGSRKLLDDGVWHGLAVLEDNRVFAWGWDQVGRLDVPNGLLNSEQISGPWNDNGGNCITETCDRDSDGTLDCDDKCPDDPQKTEPGQCGCGNEETDTDDDGIADCNDPCPEWPYDCSEDGQTLFVAVGQSIQTALGYVPDGGTVQLAEGTYPISGPFGLVHGAGDYVLQGVVDEFGIPATILDAEGDGRILTINAGQTSATVIENIQFINGNRENVGGALAISESSSPMIRNCTFENNHTDTDGGAVYVQGSSPTFDACTFATNTTAVDGEGGGVYAVDSDLTIQFCYFIENTAGGGGGLVLENSSGSEVNVTGFWNNIADLGGGVYLGSSDVTFNQCLIEGNTATNAGGGLYLYLSTASAASTIICSNTPDQFAGNGGLDDLGDNCILDDCGEDLDGNGVPDSCDPDCDEDGVPDGYEILQGTQFDCDGDGIPDDCAIEDGLVEDCNENGVPDECDIANGTEQDVNSNSIPDTCDLLRGDLNLDGCIDGGDLGLLVSLWGFPNPPIGDLNQDGMIDGADLGLILFYWAPCP